MCIRDRVRPGGMVAVITTKGTLDKANPTIRKFMAERAELVGAIRLPNTAFKMCIRDRHRSQSMRMS